MSETRQKEFAAAQVRLSELVAEHRRIAENVARKEHEQKVSSLTLQQLQNLPNQATPVYRTLGKAFILSEMPQVQDRLKSVSANSVIEREKLLTRKSHLEDSIVNAEHKLKQIYEELTSN